MPTTPPTDKIQVIADEPEALAIDILPMGFTGAARGLLVIGILICLFLLALTTGQMLGMGWRHGISIVIHISMWITGLGMIAGAISMAKRRASIALAGGRLLVIQSGLRKEERLEIGSDELADVVVATATEQEQRSMLELQLHLKNGIVKSFLAGRPEMELNWLATKLRERLPLPELSLDELADEDDEDESETGDSESRADSALRDVDAADLRVPAGSKIAVLEQADGILVDVPPAGIFKGVGCFLFMFASIWCVILIPITLAFIHGRQNGQAPPWGNFLIGAFWLVGVSLLLVTINAGRRRTELTISRRQLNIVQTGLLGRKTREWSKDEIDHVTVGNSNISVNNRPLPELQIHLQSGAKRGLLAGRDRAELQWIASAITRTMRLSSR